MKGSTFIACVFPYIAVGLFVLGTGWRFIRWFLMPARVKWALYPIPEGLPDRIGFMLKEIFTFRTLYRFHRRLWFGSFILHMAMGGFVIAMPLYALGWLPGPLPRIALAVLVVAAMYLIVLRRTDRDLKAISTPEELFNLGFLALVAAACLLASHQGDYSTRPYFLSLMTFAPDPSFLTRDQLAAISLGGFFLIYLPWSRMAHYLSKFFTYHGINWQKH